MPGLSLRSTTIQISGLNHAACVLASPASYPIIRLGKLLPLCPPFRAAWQMEAIPCRTEYAGSLLTCWLSFSQMGLVAPFIEEVRTHWVTSVNFTGYKPVPKTSDLSRHKSELLWAVEVTWWCILLVGMFFSPGLRTLAVSAGDRRWDRFGMRKSISNQQIVMFHQVQPQACRDEPNAGQTNHDWYQRLFCRLRSLVKHPRCLLLNLTSFLSRRCSRIRRSGDSGASRSTFYRFTG